MMIDDRKNRADLIKPEKPCETGLFELQGNDKRSPRIGKSLGSIFSCLGNWRIDKKFRAHIFTATPFSPLIDAWHASCNVMCMCNFLNKIDMSEDILKLFGWVGLDFIREFFKGYFSHKRKMKFETLRATAPKRRSKVCSRKSAISRKKRRRSTVKRKQVFECFWVYSL